VNLAAVPRRARVTARENRYVLEVVKNRKKQQSAALPLPLTGCQVLDKNVSVSSSRSAGGERVVIGAGALTRASIKFLLGDVPAVNRHALDIFDEHRAPIETVTQATLAKLALTRISFAGHRP